MTVVEHVSRFAEDLNTTVLVTDTDFSAAGPKGRVSDLVEIPWRRVPGM
jgi:hypothetical protein